MIKNAKTAKEKRVWKKANGKCAHCGREVSGRNRTVDHVVPKVYGGGYDFRNLMPLCKTCNQKRDCKWVNPSEYYAFAAHSAVQDSEQYIAEWTHSRTDANGTLVIKLENMMELHE